MKSTTRCVHKHVAPCVAPCTRTSSLLIFCGVQFMVHLLGLVQGEHRVFVWDNLGGMGQYKLLHYTHFTIPDGTQDASPIDAGPYSTRTSTPLRWT